MRPHPLQWAALPAIPFDQLVLRNASLFFKSFQKWLPKPERGETPIQLRRAKY
jgi:hypothetical protein